MVRSKLVILLVIFGMVLPAACAAEKQNMGAEDITLEGGSKGKVPFPHRRHQDNLKDCNICHDTFPQSIGAIDDYKSQGKLKKKQVMNKLCTKCHKAEKRAGKAEMRSLALQCGHEEKPGLA